LPDDAGLVIVECSARHELEVVRLGGLEFRGRAREGRVRFERGDTELELRVVGYPFSEGNFLDIRVDASFAGLHWSKVDRSLETFEVAHLADWLEGDPVGRTQRDVIDFIEPNSPLGARPTAHCVSSLLTCRDRHGPRGPKRSLSSSSSSRRRMSCVQPRRPYAVSS
jgi:hypothetical protein